MQNEKRHFYLENTWEKYPPLPVSAFSVLSFIKKFAEISMGKVSAKSQDFQIGGRLFRTHDSLWIKSDGEQIRIEFKFKNQLTDILDSGDHVLISASWDSVQVESRGFEARPFQILVSSVKLLAPALTQTQHENMDFKRAKQWMLLLSLIRKCFGVLEFTEVRSPTLVPSPGTEPYLDHFTTTFKDKTYYLPTSPELHLKKMLSRGWVRIYEFKNCFRNNEVSEHHQPEFTMLEWYRAYSGLAHLEKDVKSIFNYLKLHWPDPVSNFGFLTSTTVAELFQKYCNFTLTPKTTQTELVHLCSGFGISTQESDSFDDLFFRIFIEKIENHLGMSGPQIVKYYPPTQAALARLTEDGWAARFEVYWKGLELANAFDELNDPAEQRRRCDSDNILRKRLGRPEVPIDQEFINALDCGLPPSAGIALGVDRLFMALVNESDIRKTREFYLSQ